MRQAFHSLFVMLLCLGPSLACSSSGGSNEPPGLDGEPWPMTVAGYSACPPEGASNSLLGAGATFPYPFYSKLTSEYDKLCGVRINYQSVGSGAGIQQITSQTVDFGATDGIMKAEQQKTAEAAGGPILHIPMTLAPVTIIYNLPGIKSGDLRLSPDVLADIFLKRIKSWNDPRIAAINPSLKLPNAKITVVHRSDGSGTTNILTDYLSKVSPAWKESVGAANAVKWPGDVGAQGNEGVVGQVKLLPGTIGYTELTFAKQVKVSYAQIQNQSGEFVTPSLQTAAAAAEGVSLPDDMKVLINNPTNPAAYPIASFTWLLVYVNGDESNGRALAHFIWWSIHDGQKLAASQDFPQLSTAAVEKAAAQVLSLRCGDAPCLQP